MFALSSDVPLHLIFKVLQPYLLYIVKKICDAVGYSYDFTAWEEKEEHRYLVACNTLPKAWHLFFV